MTLILFAKNKDGLVLVSDKQGSIGGGEKIIVKKIFLSKNKNYVLSLAGDGNRIEQIYAVLKTLSIKKQDIEQKINSIISMTYEKNSDQIEGILLIRNNGKHDIFRIATDFQKVIILPYDAPFACFGLSSGKTMSTFLSQFIDIEKSKLRNMTEFLISSLDIISQSYDGIGTIEHGFDVLVIKNNGEMLKNSRFTNNGFGKIKFIMKKSKINVLNSILSKPEQKKKKTKSSKKDPILQSLHKELPDFTKIKLPDLSTIDLSKIEIPKVNQIDFSKIEIPKVNQIDFSKIEIPKVNQIDFSKIEIPKVNQIDFSKIEIPKVNQIDFSKIEIPKVNQIDFSKIEIPKVNQIDFSKIEISKIDPTKSTSICQKCGKLLKTKNEIDMQTCTQCNKNS